MNGRGSVGVARGRVWSAIIIRRGVRLSANAFLVLELVLSPFSSFYCLPCSTMQLMCLVF